MQVRETELLRRREEKDWIQICRMNMPLISVLSMTSKILVLKSAFSSILYLEAQDWGKI